MPTISDDSGGTPEQGSLSSLIKSNRKWLVVGTEAQGDHRLLAVNSSSKETWDYKQERAGKSCDNRLNAGSSGYFILNCFEWKESRIQTPDLLE